MPLIRTGLTDSSTGRLVTSLLNSGNSLGQAVSTAAGVAGSRFLVDPNSWAKRAQHRPDPLLEFSWDVMLVSPVGILPSEYIEDVTIPMPRFDVEHSAHQAINYYFATHVDYGSSNVKIYETYNAEASRFFTAWASRIRRPNGNFLAPAEYKGKMYVWVKDPASQATVATFTLHGVFPSTPNPINLGSQGGLVTLDYELSIDRVDLT